MKSRGPSPEVQANQSLLKTGEVCDRFKVSRDWVYHRVRPDALDSLPYVRLGRVLRFEPEKVQQYLEAHRKIERGGRLATTDGIVRVNARRKRAMARKRFQKGHVHLRGKRDRYWEGFYREDILHPDGRVERKQRSRNLGRLVDIQTKRLAERKLAEILNDVNDVDYRPRSVATLREFVEEKYMKLKLSQKKKLTQDSYRLNLNKHILPALGDRPLAEIDQEDVQALLNQKADQGLSSRIFTHLSR